MILRVLPSKSPTVAFIWAIATRNRGVILIPPAAVAPPVGLHYNTGRSTGRGEGLSASDPKPLRRRGGRSPLRRREGPWGVTLSVSAAGAAGFLADVQHLTGALGAAPARAATPAAALREIRHLECVQIDPVAVVERNQHLVLAARVPGYAPARLVELLHRGRLFEYWANAICAIPIEDFPMFEGTRRWFQRYLASEIAALRPVVRRIVAQLETEGPRPARAFASPERIRGHWGAERQSHLPRADAPVSRGPARGRQAGGRGAVFRPAGARDPRGPPRPRARGHRRRTRTTPCSRSMCGRAASSMRAIRGSDGAGCPPPPGGTRSHAGFAPGRSCR